MKLLFKNKTILLAFLIFILVLFFYSSFLKSEPQGFVIDESVKDIGADLVETYNDLQSVTLNQKLFSSQAYTRLIDFGTNIPERPAGRTNPFDLIGRD
ncbi:MAG: hypothetical protein ABIF06_01515 [bacterium]